MQNERIFIGTGGNLGDRHAMLSFAQTRIDQGIGRVVGASSVYVNPSWGFTGPEFYNQVLEIRSEYHPMELLSLLKDLEEAAGRKPSYGGYANRTLDADLLYYGNRQCVSPVLHLPHPLTSSRRFVLEPFAQIAPEFRDPKTGKSVLEMLKCCPDQAEGYWL